MNFLALETQLSNIFHQMDVKTIFLNGFTCTVYMEQLEGIVKLVELLVC